MPQLQHVLVTVQLKPENRALLCAQLTPARITWCHPDDRDIIKACISDVDAAILQADADALILSGERLRWIHCCHAGLDQTARPEVLRRGIILTGSSGRSAPVLAEHALMFLLALTYDVPRLLKAQAEHHWMGAEDYGSRTGLYGKTIGIVGLGKTGTELAKLAKQLHMRVLAWRRRPECPEWVDRVYAADSGQGIGELLEQSDFVVLCASLNSETKNLIDRESLKRMKSTAYLVNIGRGSLVDEQALVCALQEGWFAGAGLDVFATEPLPTDSPLWDMPNVLLTPHTTPQMPDREERTLRYVLENIQAYREGSGFVNQITARDVYAG